VSNRNLVIEQLVRENSSKLATYAHALGADSSFAQDAASEAFLRLCCLRTINRDSAKAWLYKVCRNIVFDDFKRRCREQSADIGQMEHFVDLRLDSSAEVSRDESCKLIMAEIAKLSTVQREIVFMRYFNGLEYSQIAFVLDMTVSNVGVTLNRALAQIRKNLEDIL